MTTYRSNTTGSFTVTDFLIDAARQELEKNRQFLDANPDIRSVNLSIKIDRKSLRPRSVVFQPQTESLSGQ